MMKKSLSAALFAAFAMMFGACNPGENEYHYTAIFYPNPDGWLYADQTVDSLKFTTFDDWALSAEASWVKFSNNPELVSGTVPSGTYVQGAVPVYFEPNTTGETRYARINLASYGNVLSAMFHQYPYHNITRPAIIDSTATYALTKEAAGGTDSIVFNAFSQWSVCLEDESDTVWVKTSGALTGEPGTGKVVFEIAPTEETQARTARLLLQGAGVTTPVTLTRKAAAAVQD